MATQQAITEYRQMVHKALADGTMTNDEMNILVNVRKNLGISYQEHQFILEQVRQEILQMQGYRGGPIQAANSSVTLQRTDAEKYAKKPPQQAPVQNKPPAQAPAQQRPAVVTPGQQAQRPAGAVHAPAQRTQAPAQRLAGSAQAPAQRPQPQQQPGAPGQKQHIPGIAVRGPPQKDGHKATKVSTGAKKLDTLIGGGMDLRSNAIVIGPPFIGKETFIYQFIIEGLRAGIPTVLITTEKTTSDLKNKIMANHKDLPLYDQKGLIRVVDCYSNTIGFTGAAPNTVYVNGCANYQEVLKVIDTFQKHVKEKFFTHRVVLLSLSPVIRACGINDTMNFLNGFASKNKFYNAVCLIDMVSGLHPENEIQAVENAVDGTFEFKTEGGKNNIRIKGMGDIPNREWITYDFTGGTFDIKAGMGFQYIT